MDGTQSLGGENQKGHDHAGERGGQHQPRGAEVQNDGEFFGEENNGKEGANQEHQAGSDAKTPAVLLVGVPAGGVLEEALVAHGLDDEEEDVEGHAKHREENGLPGGEGGRIGGDGEFRQNETENRQRHNQAEISASAFEIECLLVVAPRTENEGNAGQPAHDNHHHGEHGVARQSRVVFTGKHHGGNHAHLHADDAECEDQCAERFAEFVREGVGVADDGERAPEDRHQQPSQENTGFGGCRDAADPTGAYRGKDGEGDPTTEDSLFTQ